MPNTPRDFALEDQFGRPHPVRFADAALTAVVFSGRATVGDGLAWVRALPGALAARGAGAVRVVAVAAVGGVSGVARGIVRAALAGQPAVPIDWGDAVAEGFGYRAGTVRVVLVDDAGRVRAAADGPPTAATVAAFAAAAEAGREEPRVGPRRAPRPGRD